MSLRHRLSSLVAIALTATAVQLVASASPAQAYATPVGDWSSTQSAYNPSEVDGNFSSDDALDLVVLQSSSGLSIVNVANGAKRVVVGVDPSSYASYDHAVVSGDGSTVVAQAGPIRGYPNPGNELTVLRGFDPETLQGGTSTTFTTVPANRTIVDMALSQDGSRLAFGGEGVSVVDTTTGAYTEVLPATGCATGNTFNYHRVSLSNDGKTLADYVGEYCNGGVSQARVWDITDPATPALLWSHDQQDYSQPLSCSQVDRPTSIVLSGDGTHVAVADQRHGELEPTDGYNHDLGSILVRDLVTGTERTWFDQPGQESGRICSIDLSEDGSRMAFEAADKHETGYSSWYGEDIWVTETTAAATPVHVAQRDFNDGNYGWALAGLSSDGNGVLFSGKTRNSTWPLWSSRDPATLALAWPSGAALTTGQVAQTFVDLQWPAAIGSVASYRVTGGPAGPVDVAAAQTGTTISGLNPGTAYHFEVRARSGATSTDPLALDVTTAAPAGPGTAALTATVTADDTVRLQWDPKAGADGYQVLRATGAGAAAKVADIAAGTTQWTDETTDGATTYTYRVAAVTGGTAVPHTVNATVTTAPVAITSVTGVATQSLGNAVPGAPVTVRAVGQPHRTAQASLTVQGIASPAPVALTETTPGRYDGNVTLPAGATRLDSVTVTLTDGAGSGTGHSATKTTAINLPVGAALVAHLQSSGFAGRLVASSASGGWSVSQTLNLSADQTRTIGVPPATDISVRYIRTSDGQPLGGPSGLGAVTGQVLDVPTKQLSEPARMHLHGDPAASSALLEVSQDGRSQQVRLTDDGTANLTGFSAGSATIDLVESDEQSWRFVPLAPQVQTLQIGTNDVTVPLQARSTATLAGHLLPPATGVSVTGANVVVVQRHGSASATFNARADSSGDYQVDGLVAGLPTTIAVWHPLVRTDADVPVTVQEGANSLDLQVEAVDGYLVTPTVDLVDAGGTVQRIALDWRTAVHYRVYLGSPGGRESSVSFGLSPSGSVNLHGRPGDPVQLCADGLEFGYDSACATATLPASTATAVPINVAISAVGRTTVGYSLRTSAGQPDPSRAVRIVATQGSDAVVVDRLVDDGTFSLPSGTWDLTVVDPQTSQLLADLPSRALTGAQADLGTVQLTAAAPYTGPGNGLSAQQQSVSPGGGLDLTATWTPGTAQPSGTLTWRLPGSVTVTDPSIAATVNGDPVSASLSGGNLSVSVPPAAAGASGHATVHLDVAPDADAGYVVVRAGIAGHPLGQVAVDLPAVTLDAPGRVARRTIPLTGRATAGATVTVVCDGLSIGTAVASATGAWKTTISLPAGRQHTLQAATEAFATEPTVVLVDPLAPDFRSVTVNQDGLRDFTRDPGTSYPFVVVPGMSMTVSTTLTDGSRLASIDAVLDGVHHPMTRSGNTWSASFVPGFPQGAITFDYVEAVIPRDYPREQVMTTRPESLDNYLGSLTPAQRAKIGTPSVTVNATMDQAHVTTDSAVLDIDVSDGSGISLAGKQQIAEGVWLFEPATLTTVGDHVTGKVTLLAQEEQGARGAGRRTVDPDKVKKIGVVFNTLATLNSDREALSASDKYDKLSDALERASGCSQSSYNDLKARLDDLLVQALMVDATSAALEVGGLILAPETFGLGTVVLWSASFVLSKILDQRIDQLLDFVDDDMDKDASCPKKKPKNSTKPGGGSGGGSTGPGGPGTGPGADPFWIYDPSGVVTDGVDPIAGATATLTRANSENGAYSVWDAESYEQINNLVTGADGAYGWNVPEGWYVVTATAPGRITAQSVRLQVLPPRTGVDLVLAPAALADVVSTTAAGSVVTVTFDQWMRTDFLTGSQLTVTDAADAPVGATVVPVSPRTGTDGESYAKSVRLTVPTPTAAKPLTVTVDDGVQDVAGRPMAADVVDVVTVTPPPPPPRSCTTQQQAASAAAAAVTKAKAGLTSATKALGKAKKKLKKLKKAGAPAAKIKKAKKKVKAATTTVGTAKSSLARANAAATTANQALATCQAAPRPSGRTQRS